jgi:CTD kinase subunit alpha
LPPPPQHHAGPPSTAVEHNEGQLGLQGASPYGEAAPAPAPPPRTTKDAYDKLVQVGEGTYGKVYKAKDVETGQLVALKRIRMEAEKDGFPITAIREVKLLQSLSHENVVRLDEMMVSKGAVPNSAGSC